MGSDVGMVIKERCPFCTTPCGTEWCPYDGVESEKAKFNLETSDDSTIRYPCKKQVVKAYLKLKSGITVVGENSIYKDVASCPREGMPSGSGYDLCKSVCGQKEHAEIDAIKTAARVGLDIEGSVLTLVGHSYCCEPCLKAMAEVGVLSYTIDGVTTYL